MTQSFIFERQDLGNNFIGIRQFLKNSIRDPINKKINRFYICLINFFSSFSSNSTEMIVKLINYDFSFFYRLVAYSFV